MAPRSTAAGSGAAASWAPTPWSCKAQIGEECIIAAGAIVRLGMKIPPRSLVAGVPARIVRQLSDEDIHFPNQAATDFYLAINAQFRDEGALKIIE